MNGPLTEEHTAQLAAAMERAGKIRKATKIAGANGWMLGISAALSAPFALGSQIAFLLMAALGILSWNEFRGRDMLRAFDSNGPELLWKNQLGLMAVLVVYCLWAIRIASAAPVDPDLLLLQELAPEMADLMTSLTVTVFQGVILATVVMQGLMARMYHSRIAMVRQYWADTPGWVVEVIRMLDGGGGQA